MDRQELWLANKAFYGPRVSPRAWAIYLDAELPKLRIQVFSKTRPANLQGHCRSMGASTQFLLRQNSVSHPLWHIVICDDSDSGLYGFLVVYEDDF